MNFLRSIVLGQLLVALAEVPFAQAYDGMDDSRRPTEEEIRNCQRQFGRDGVDPAFCVQGRLAICANGVLGAGYSAQAASVVCSNDELQTYVIRNDGYFRCMEYLRPHFDAPSASQTCSSGAASLIARSITRDQYEVCRETAIEAGFDATLAAYECMDTPGLPESFDRDKGDPKGGRALIENCFAHLRGLVDDRARAHYCGTFPSELASAEGGKCVHRLIKERGWQYHGAIVKCSTWDAARRAVGNRHFDACMDSAIWEEAPPNYSEETRLDFCAKSNLDPQTLGCIVRANRHPGLDAYLHGRYKAGGLHEIGAICRNSNSHLQRCLRESSAKGLTPQAAMDTCLD